MSEEVLDYEKDVSIDAEALDVEWINQPRIYMKWAKLASLAEDAMKKAKENIDFVDSTNDKEFRNMNTGVKFTEAMVKAYVETHKLHEEATNKFHDAVYKYNICNNAVRAMDHKKTSLENLVRLWGGAYFAGPKEPRDLKKILNMQQQWQQKTEEKRSEISDRINSRRRRLSPDKSEV